MDKRWLAFVWLWLATACGPGELPGFANPPPDDSGVRSDAGETDTDADTDADVEDEDAGASDADTR